MNRPEEMLQKAVAQFLDLALLPGAVYFHVPNQRGTRKRWENALLKALGVKAGIPDIVVVYAARAFFIELKAPGRLASKIQKDMHAQLGDAGCPVAVCKTLPEVEGVLAAWEIPMRAVL